MSGDLELEALRKKRLAEMQAQEQMNQDLGGEQEAAARQQEEFEEAKKRIMRSILTAEARERLAKIRMVKPELAESVEQQLIGLAQSGRIQNQIDDATLKQILEKLVPKKREPTIRRL